MTMTVREKRDIRAIFFRTGTRTFQSIITGTVITEQSQQNFVLCIDMSITLTKSVSNNINSALIDERRMLHFQRGFVTTLR
jgi:uncharacterized FAD-dependent dehydrogenase